MKVLKTQKLRKWHLSKETFPFPHLHKYPYPYTNAKKAKMHGTPAFYIYIYIFTIHSNTKGIKLFNEDVILIKPWANQNRRHLR